MPVGRPRKSLAQKLADGDTRKLGARRFAEECAATRESKRGAPPMPVDFEAKRPVREIQENAEALARHERREARRARAKSHYAYICKCLSEERLLSVADMGILSAMSQTYALMVEAFEAGLIREHNALHAQYTHSSSLVGLNEYSRGKMPRQANTEMTDEELALSAELPDEDRPRIQ